MRPLSEIYEQLGYALLHAAGEFRDGEQTATANLRFEEAAQAFERAIREGGGSNGVGLGLARSRKGQGRLEDALRTCLEVIRADPACWAEAFQIAHDCLTRPVARALGPWIDSEWAPVVLRVQLDPPGRAAIRRFLGRVDLYRGKYDTAADLYRTALELKPDDSYVLEGLGEALWQAGQASAAVPFLESAVRRVDPVHLPERAATARLKLGLVLVGMGRHQAAIRVLRQGLALGGRCQADLWTALARARLGLGRFDGAVSAAEAAMEREANLAAPHTVLAQALLEQRRHKEAVASAEAALGFDPQDLSAIRVEGRALLEGKVDVEQGIRLSRYYLDHSPPDNETRLFLAQGMRSAGRPASEVVDLLKAGIEVKSPDKPVTLYLELAQAYQDAGDPASALAVLDNLCAKGAGGDLVRWWRIRADVLRAQGNAPGAFDAYKQAVTLDPSNLTALERFATLLDTEQRFEEAARVWQQAADARPYDGRLKVNLALAVRSAGDNQRAWTAVKEAIEQGVYGEDRARAFLLRAELADILQAPHDELVEAYYEAGRQSYGKGDLNQALHWLDRATGLDTRHQDARWYRADTLRRRASLPKFPYWDADLLAEAGNYWRATLAFGPPNRDVAWSYVSGALIADGEGIFSSSGKRAALVWEAVAYLERSLVLDERNIYAWINLSRLHRVVGNNATALIASERALQIDPDDLSAIDERIGALANLGDAKGARDLIDKRLQREPTTWAEGANAFILYLEDHLPAAVEQIGRVIEADPDDIWNLSFRGDCLRRMALKEKAPGKYDQARENYRKVLECKGKRGYAAYETAFAWAAYGLGELKLAVDTLDPLLGDALDPSCENYRTIGCCFLRLGDRHRAEPCLERGIDHADRLLQLRSLGSLDFAEIEQDAADWPNREPVLALLRRARDRIDAAMKRPKWPPSPRDELNRFIDWKQAREQTEGWSWTGASAGLARVALGAGELEQAEAIYRALSQDTGRFPEAAVGLEKVSARCRDLGEEKLRNGWDQLDSAKEAIRLFERTLGLDPDASASERGELLVRMALAQFQASTIQVAPATFAEAVKAFESAGRADCGVLVGKNCSAFLPDVRRYWALDEYFRRLVNEESTPDPLRSVLPQIRQRLREYLETALDPVDRDDESRKLRPIILEIAGNLVPEERKEKEWPLLKRFVPEMRERVEDELGVRIPGVRIRSNPDLASYTYIIMLDEVPVAHGRVVAGAKYSPSTASALEAAGIDVAELEQAAHPLSNQPGWWIPQKYWDSVQQTNGCLLWPDPVQFLVAHLEAVLRNNLADFVGIEEVWGLLDRWGRTDKGRELVGAALPDVPARERFVRVLRALVRERAPVTDWESILLAVGEVGLTSDETDEVVRHVRLAIKPYLPGNRPGARLLKVPRELDRTIMAWVRTADGRSVLAMPPELTQELLTKLRELVQRDDPATVLVTEETNVRDPLGRLMRLEFPSITVQSQEETVCEEDRKTALAWVPLIAEWGEFWRQTMEACDAS